MENVGALLGDYGYNKHRWNYFYFTKQDITWVEKMLSFDENRPDEYKYHAITREEYDSIVKATPSAAITDPRLISPLTKDFLTKMYKQEVFSELKHIAGWDDFVMGFYKLITSDDDAPNFDTGYKTNAFLLLSDPRDVWEWCIHFLPNLPETLSWDLKDMKRNEIWWRRADIFERTLTGKAEVILKDIESESTKDFQALTEDMIFDIYDEVKEIKDYITSIKNIKAVYFFGSETQWYYQGFLSLRNEGDPGIYIIPDIGDPKEGKETQSYFDYKNVVTTYRMDKFNKMMSDVKLTELDYAGDDKIFIFTILNHEKNMGPKHRFLLKYLVDLYEDKPDRPDFSFFTVVDPAHESLMGDWEEKEQVKFGTKLTGDKSLRSAKISIRPDTVIEVDGIFCYTRESRSVSHVQDRIYPKMTPFMWGSSTDLSGISKYHEVLLKFFVSKFKKAHENAKQSTGILKLECSKISEYMQGRKLGKGAYGAAYELVETRGNQKKVVKIQKYRKDKFVKIAAGLKADAKLMNDVHKAYPELAPKIHGITVCGDAELILGSPVFLTLMDFVDGLGFNRHVQSMKGSNPVSQSAAGKAISISKMILDNLHRIHAINLFHGDLNLANILIRTAVNTSPSDIIFIDFMYRKDWSPIKDLADLVTYYARYGTVIPDKAFTLAMVNTVLDHAKKHYPRSDFSMAAELIRNSSIYREKSKVYYLNLLSQSIKLDREVPSYIGLTAIIKKLDRNMSGYVVRYDWWADRDENLSDTMSP